MERKYEDVYLVFLEDKLVYASEEREFAEAYIERQANETRKSYLDEMEIEDDDIGGNWAVEYQMGYDSDEDSMYEIHKVNLTGNRASNWLDVADKHIAMTSIYSLLGESQLEDYY